MQAKGDKGKEIVWVSRGLVLSYSGDFLVVGPAAKGRETSQASMRTGSSHVRGVILLDC